MVTARPLPIQGESVSLSAFPFCYPVHPGRGLTNILKVEARYTSMAVILESDRLLFRDHEPEDLEPFCDMEADSEVRRFVGGAPRSRAGAEAKFHQVYLQPVPDRLALWATVYKPEG